MMGKLWRILPRISTALLLIILASPTQAQEQNNNESEIDAFMRKAIETRSKDWDRRYDYVFREMEELRIRGDIGDAPFVGFVKEWAWYVRDGYLVRSPVSVDGLPIGEKERLRSEDRWINNLKKNQQKGKKSGADDSNNEEEADSESDEDRFFGFKFKPGNYFYAGREMLDNREVVVIEYYPPQRLTEADIRKAEKNDDFDVQVEKSLAITLYALPDEPRIVRMVMHNTGMDFLPGQSFLKILDVRAEMNMFQHRNGDWLVRDFAVGGTAATASGEINVSYVRRFDQYSKAKVKVQFRFAPRTTGSTGGGDEEQ